jgi:hypothetical protein
MKLEDENFLCVKLSFSTLSQLRGGIAQGVPYTETISDLLCVSFLLYLVGSTAELPCTVHYHPYGVYVHSRVFTIRIVLF